ncbi:hypothetical protein [Terasakiella pusilla]|uniref:hypothetical protein n=1 Tax=Terasakiella pusilla TaxID=64973 RepID=UPI000490AB21|nr:hypothetical protein [Terasakiella pusilla]
MSSLQPFVPATKSNIAYYPIKIDIEIDHPGVTVLIHNLLEINGKVSVGNAYSFDELQYFVNEAIRSRGQVILTLWLFNTHQVMEVLKNTHARLIGFDVQF